MNNNGFTNLVRIFGKIVGDCDKKPADVQLATGKALIAANYHEALKDINNAYNFCKINNMAINEFAFEIANVSQAVVDTLNGNSTGYLAKLDTKQSGLTLQSLITRDEIALNTLLSDVDIYTWFIEKLDIDVTRKQMKKLVIPRYYGSEKGIIKKFEALGHPEKAYEFFDLYAELLPKCDMLRAIMLDAWQQYRDSYHWLAPDMGSCNQAVQEAEPEVWSRATTKFEWNSPKYERTCCANVYIPKKGGRPFGDDGTRSLGANLIHSLDAYVLRELVRRCSQADRYTALWYSLGEPASEINAKSSKIQEFYDFWKQTGVTSLRIMEFVSEGDVLPTEYFNAIEKEVSRLPECRFDIAFTVHDEFACHVNYAHLMQQQFNYILSGLYQGHYLDYVKDAFDWETARWCKESMLDITLTDALPDTVEKIEKSDVILQ